MNYLSDLITYVRRIVKTPSNAVLSDNLIIDYINRFWISDVDARMQLFDLKNKYQFQTSPGVDRYNMPLYSIQSETPGNPSSLDIGMYPVYQGFIGPAYINGIQVPLQTQRTPFFNIWPNVVQNMVAVATGNGGTNYDLNFPIGPNSTVPPNPPFNSIIRGHIDIAGIISTGQNIDPPFSTSADALGTTGKIATMPVTSVDAAVFITALDEQGNNMVITDSGYFLNNGNNQPNYGLLINPGPAPFGNTAIASGYSTTLNTVNYVTGTANVTFPRAVATGSNINVQVFFFQSGLPRAILFYNNTLTLRSPPAQQYLVELDAYLSPAAFFNTAAAIPFSYMAEYIARGAARKILADTGDQEQFNFYEPLFREQELLVWKRSQRQFTNNRTETIYSQGMSQMGSYGNSNLGGTV